MKKKIITILLSACMIFTMAPLSAIADGGAGGSGSLITNDGVDTQKNVTDNKDGSYTITLDASVNGSADTGSRSRPLDVVFVLDQSGSMTDSFYEDLHDDPTVKFTPLSSSDSANMEALLAHYDYLNVNMPRNPMFYKDSTGYYGEVYFMQDLGTEYKFVYMNRSKQIVNEYITKASYPNKTAIPNWLKGNLYDVSFTSRLDALKTAAGSFVSSLQVDAEEHNAQHRVAMVGFASSGESGNYQSSPFENTEILSTASPVLYPNITDSNYRNAFVDVNVNGEVNSRLTNAISDLDAHGGTWINHGLDMAKNILDKGNDGNTERERVVVVLTDGVPGNGTWGSSVSGDTCASPALATAKNIKDSGVSIYTVGIIDGISEKSTGSNTGNSAAMCNYFLQNLSSNNGSVSDPSFFLPVGSSSELEEVFDTIFYQIDKPALSGDTLGLKDKVTKYFDIMPDSVKVYTQDYLGNGSYSSTKKQEYPKISSSVEDITVTMENNLVTVNGFDMEKNFTSDQIKEDGTYGKKLLVEFKITPKDGFWGGNGVPTNDNDPSGVFKITDEGDEEIIENFDPDPPAVDVPIAKPTVKGSSHNIYMGGDTPDPDSLITVSGPDASYGNPYNLSADDAWKTDFVDITDNTGSLGIVNTEDGTYTATVTVTPKNDGTYKAVTGNADVDVDVFKPYFTVTAKDFWTNRDTEVNLPANDIVNASAPSVIWKHGSTTAANADPAMEGSAPSVTVKSYTFESVGSVDGTLSGEKYTTRKNDADFNIVSMKADIGDCSGYVTSKSGGNLTVIPDNADGKTGHDFTIHIKIADLVIKKQYVDKNGANTTPEDPDQVCIFNVKGTGSNADIDMQVAIKGNGEVTVKEVPYGSYTVSELTDWSWRYEAVGGSSKSVTIGENGASVSFKNKLDDSQWQSAMADVKNVCESTTEIVKKTL